MEKVSLLLIFAYQLVVHLTTEFANWPETVVFSWLVSKGYVPYRDFFDNHNPGVYYVNGLLFRLFGVDFEILRWEMTLIMMANTVGVYRLARLVHGRYCAVGAAAVFVLLESQLFGNGIWYEQFVLLFFLNAAYYLLRDPLGKLNPGRCFVVGLFFGLAAIFKQQTLFVFLGTAILVGFGSATVFSQQQGAIKRNLLMLALGAAGPPILHILVLATLGAGEKYIYGTIYMPLFEWTLYRAPGFGDVIRLLLWFCVVLAQLLLGLRSKTVDARFAHWSIFVFFLTSLSFDFPHHGRVHLIPAAAFVSIAAAGIASKIREHPWVGLILAVFLVTAIVNHFKSLSFDGGRKFFTASTERDDVAAWIKEHTSSLDRIYVVNSLQFYTLLDRLPATYNIYGYWWLMHGRYGIENILADLERTKPTYVVAGISESNPSEFSGSVSPLLRDYIIMNYEVIPGTSKRWLIMKRKEI